MVKIKKNYKITSFLNASFTISTNSLSNKYLNNLPQFKAKFFSTEVLAEYLATEISKEFKIIKSKLYRIEVSEDPIRTVCLEVK